MWTSSFPRIIFWQSCPFPFRMVLVPLSKVTWPYIWGFIFEISILLYCSLCLCLWQLPPWLLSCLLLFSFQCRLLKDVWYFPFFPYFLFINVLVHWRQSIWGAHVVEDYIPWVWCQELRILPLFFSTIKIKLGLQDSQVCLMFMTKSFLINAQCDVCPQWSASGWGCPCLALPTSYSLFISF